MHIALRAPKTKEIFVDGENVVPAVHAVLDKISDFSSRVRSGEWVGATGKRLTSVVSIGIGGSYLGPEFVFEALRTHGSYMRKRFVIRLFFAAMLSFIRLNMIS